MPIGSGVETLRLLPSVPYVIDPASFAAMTTENVAPLTPIAAPGSSQRVSYQLPDADVVARLRINFDGQVVVSNANQTPSFAWPYGLIANFTLTANGISHDLWNLSGNDIFELNFVDHPGRFSNSDVFPGGLGGGTAIVPGIYPLHLSWSIPIAVDDAWLVAALFAQSSQTLLNGSILQENTQNLLAAGGNVADFTISGSFTITETSYEIPIDNNGRMILPDVTKLHQVVAIYEPWTNTGANPVTLLRTAGQLMRVFVSGTSAFNTPLSAAPGTALTGAIDEIDLMYGLRATPYVWAPASVLAKTNELDYGALVPLDTVVIDQMARNPVRDMILLQGVTNLRANIVIDSAVVPTVGQANLRCVEEILI
ncbi:MAG TPA: hypothetical protein VMR97_07890 [Acidimicrobiales bacterium]|nr:hypothetical protein [Acidimicrobiales bacterium]